ncbi:hypothetical protein niasHT_036726 [Heterodera trifolii]|uniref:Uncharacterized protein n=1 Tax=Heterodera trifolii TaxID=157864 RepID=A0ABD2ISX1_9BILA
MDRAHLPEDSQPRPPSCRWLTQAKLAGTSGFFVQLDELYKTVSMASGCVHYKWRKLLRKLIELYKKAAGTGTLSLGWTSPGGLSLRFIFRSACDQSSNSPVPSPNSINFVAFIHYSFCFNKFVLKRLGGLVKEGKAPSTLHHIRRILVRGQTKAPIHVLTPSFPGSPRRSPPIFPIPIPFPLALENPGIGPEHKRSSSSSDSRSRSLANRYQSPASRSSRRDGANSRRRRIQAGQRRKEEPNGAKSSDERTGPFVSATPTSRRSAHRRSQSPASRSIHRRRRESKPVLIESRANITKFEQFRLPPAGVSRIGLSLPTAGASAAENSKEQLPPVRSSSKGKQQIAAQIHQAPVQFCHPSPLPFSSPFGADRTGQQHQTHQSSNGKKGALPFTTSERSEHRDKRDESGEEEREPIPPQQGQATHLAKPRPRGQLQPPTIGLRATNRPTSEQSVYERPIGLRANNRSTSDQSVYERPISLRANNRSTSDQSVYERPTSTTRSASSKLVPRPAQPFGQRATTARREVLDKMQRFEFENESESNMDPANEGHRDGAKHDENVQDGNGPVTTTNGGQQKVARANEATRGSNMVTYTGTNQQGVLPFPPRNLRSVSIPIRTARDRIERASGTLAARIAEAREVINQDLTEGEAGYQAARLLSMERKLQEIAQIFQWYFDIGIAVAGAEPADHHDFFYDILTAPLPAATKRLQLRAHPTPAELLQIADEHIGDLTTMRRALEDEEAITRSRLSGSLGTNSQPVGDDPPPLENRNMEEWERSFQVAAKRWQNDGQVVQQHNRRPMERVATPVMPNLDGIFQRRAKPLSVASMRMTNPAREWVNRNRDEMGAFPPATAHQPALLQPKIEQHQAHVNNDHRELQTYPIRRHIRDETEHDRNHGRDQTAQVRCMRHKTERDQTGREVQAGREPFQRAFMVRDSQPTRAQSNGTRREEQSGMNARFAGPSITHANENERSGGNWTRVATNRPIATTEKWSCSLCLRSGHRPSKCRAYPTAQARRKRLIEQKRCLRCMCSDHLFKQCQRAVRCNACRKDDHHWLLCWKSISGGQSRSFTESERRANNHATLISGMDRPTHFTAVRGMQNNQDEFKVNAGEQRAFTTFGSRLPAQQMICRVIAAAEEGEEECQTTLLFDPGSHVDCAETPLIHHLGPKPTEKRPLKVQVFGGKKQQIRSATYHLRLKRTDGEWESIEVSEVPQFCTPIRTELIESGATPESDPRTVTQTTQPQIMIGIRKFWDYVIGFRKIENGAYVIDTVFGQVLCGEGIQASSGETPAASILTTMPCGKIHQTRANEGQQIGEVGRNWKRKRKRRENSSRRIVDRDLHNSPTEINPDRSGTNEVIKSQAKPIGEMDPNQRKRTIGRIVETKGSSEHTRTRMESGQIRGRTINKIGPLEEAPPKMRKTDDRADQAVHERHEEETRAVETQSETRDQNTPSAAKDERKEAKRNGKILENRRREVEAVQPDGNANREIRNDNFRGNGPHDSDKKFGSEMTTEKSAVFGKAAEVPSAAQEEAGNSANPHSAQRHEKKYLGNSLMAPSLLNVPTKFQPNPTRSEGGDRFGADRPRAVQTEDIGYDFPEASFDERQRTEHERILDNYTERVQDGKDNQGVQAVPEAEPKKSATTRRNREIWSPGRHEPRKRGATQPRTGMALLIMLISLAGTTSGQPSIRSSGMDPNLPFREGPRVPCTTECAERGVTNVSGRELNKIEICCDGGCWATMPKSTDVNYELPAEELIHGYHCHDKCWWGSNAPFNKTRRYPTRSRTHNHGNHRSNANRRNGFENPLLQLMDTRFGASTVKGRRGQCRQFFHWRREGGGLSLRFIFRSACDQSSNSPVPSPNSINFVAFIHYSFCFNKFVLKRLGGLVKEGKAPSTLHHIRRILVRGQTKAPIHVLTPSFPGSPRRSPPIFPIPIPFPLALENPGIGPEHKRSSSSSDSRSRSLANRYQSPASRSSRRDGANSRRRRIQAGQRRKEEPNGAKSSDERTGPFVSATPTSRRSAHRRSQSPASRSIHRRRRESKPVLIESRANITKFEQFRLPPAGVSRIGLSLPTAGASAAENSKEQLPPVRSSSKGKQQIAAQIHQAPVQFCHPSPLPFSSPFGADRTGQQHQTHQSSNGKKGALPFTTSERSEHRDKRDESGEEEREPIPPQQGQATHLAKPRPS